MIFRKNNFTLIVAIILTCSLDIFSDGEKKIKPTLSVNLELSNDEDLGLIGFFVSIKNECESPIFLRHDKNNRQFILMSIHSQNNRLRISKKNTRYLPNAKVESEVVVIPPDKTYKRFIPISLYLKAKVTFPVKGARVSALICTTVTFQNETITMNRRFRKEAQLTKGGVIKSSKLVARDLSDKEVKVQAVNGTTLP